MFSLFMFSWTVSFRSIGKTYNADNCVEARLFNTLKHINQSRTICAAPVKIHAALRSGEATFCQQSKTLQNAWTFKY